MQKRVMTLVQRAEEGTLEGKKYCMRGLERLMAPEETKVKRHQAWDSIFNEQYLQRREGGFDEDHMANVYKYSTLRSQVAATKRANTDALEVENYMKDTRHSYHRRMSM
jgi:hypothetical protein